jgi:hypothetical protein
LQQGYRTIDMAMMCQTLSSDRIADFPDFCLCRRLGHRPNDRAKAQRPKNGSGWPGLSRAFNTNRQRIHPYQRYGLNPVIRAG